MQAYIISICGKIVATNYGINSWDNYLVLVNNVDSVSILQMYLRTSTPYQSVNATSAWLVNLLQVYIPIYKIEKKQSRSKGNVTIL